MNYKFINCVLIVIAFTIISCGNDINTNKVAIEYTDLNKLTNKSYISIDGLVIPHTENNTFIRYNKALPLQYINTFNSNSESAPMLKVDGKMILNRLKRILAEKNQYVFDSSFYISFNNRLIFTRKDGKPLEIKTSKNYPAKITYRE